jgi:isopenicillin N synthase-like dioxygenase
MRRPIHASGQNFGKLPRYSQRVPNRAIPVIDVAPLVAGGRDSDVTVASAIDAACRDHGFFTIVGHGVDPALLRDLDARARAFFALDPDEKAQIAMARGGRAWRGWFPVGGELTSGTPDRKEGLYFGAELPADDPRVRAGLPLHGPNLFPARPSGLRDTVLECLDVFTALGHHVMRGIALALGLDGGWFDRELTRDPTILFRIFHYPPASDDSGWGVAEHTDYGLLTILVQDESGGLELRTRDGWVQVPADPDTLVCNLGDMLDRMTGGRYRSTPHRVRSPVGASRISCPFFFDPGWDARVRPILPSAVSAEADAADRWDGASVHEAFEGTYGDYLVAKVSKVFPALRDAAL